jgi:hypothetical protein
MNRSQSKIRHMQQVNVLLEQRKLKLVEQAGYDVGATGQVTTDTTTIRPEPEEGKTIADIIGLPLNKEITCSCPELKEYLGKVNQNAAKLTGTFEMIDGDTVKFTAKGFTLTLNVTD